MLAGHRRAGEVLRRDDTENENGIATCSTVPRSACSLRATQPRSVHVGIVEQLAGVRRRGDLARHAGGVEHVEPVPGVLAGEDRAELGRQLGVGRRRRRRRRSARRWRGGRLEGVAQRAHSSSSVTNTHSQPSAVSYSRCSAENPYCSASMRSRSGPLPSGGRVRRAVEQHADVEDRGVHELALAGALPVAQRLDHGGGRDDPVAGVAVRASSARSAACRGACRRPRRPCRRGRGPSGRCPAAACAARCARSRGCGSR